jgi:hypothetical protein
MAKYRFLISIITLIFGFSFYGEFVTISLYDTYYVIAAEVIIFAIWLVIMMIFLFLYLKNRLQENEI